MSTRILQNFIDGQYVASTAESHTELVDPATEEVYAHSPVSTPAEIDAAYGAAERAFAAWGRTTPQERQLALFRLADIFKPWPIGWADKRIKGGFGVMLDDLLAGGLAAIILWNIWILTNI